MSSRMMLLASVLAGCTTAAADPVASSDAEPLESRLPVFPAEARPFGRSMADWAESWWQWIYRLPAAENPMVTPGVDCRTRQSGPVFFIPTVVDPGGAAVLDESCTVPEGKALLVTPGATLNDFPCPFPGFEPPPGVPLFDFLKDGIAPIVNSVDAIGITIDGFAVPVPFAYRTQGRRLFEVDGDPSLTSVLDPCITGAPQPAFSDGYFYMVRPLAAGRHELVIHATDTKGTDLTITWHLDMERRR